MVEETIHVLKGKKKTGMLRLYKLAKESSYKDITMFLKPALLRYNLYT